MKEQINYLSPRQRFEIQELQRLGTVEPREPQRVRTFNKLVEIGICMEQVDHQFILVEKWKDVDVSKRTRGIRGPYKGKTDFDAGYEQRYREAHLKPPPVPVVQPARVTKYDNLTWDQRIEQLLNS